MTSEDKDRVNETLSENSIYLQKELVEEAGGPLFTDRCCLLGFPRRDFSRLHTRYRLVPETYLLHDVFDSFCPPEYHLRSLEQDLPGGIGTFLEALGCYCELGATEVRKLNSRLAVPVPSPAEDEKTAVILLCWDRIQDAAKELGIDPFLHLLHAVATHEHSHAARGNRVHRSPEVLQVEETVAQWETYMFLLSIGEKNMIKAMRKLMEKQPKCYQIPIP